VSTRTAAAVVAAAVVAATMLAVPPAAAQSANPPPTLVLAQQDAWAAPGGTFTMRLHTTGAVDGLRLAITVHDRVISRSAFDATITGDNPSFGPTLTFLQPALDAYPPDGFGLRTVTLDLHGLNLTRVGVYPVEVQLRNGSDVVSGFVTHLVVADTTSTALPLEVTWVWPLVAEPTFGVDGNANPAVVGEFATDGRLGRQAALIAADTDVPLTLAPSPETLESWSTLAQTDPIGLGTGVAALRTAVPRDQVLAGPYVPLDLPSMFSGGLAGVLPPELQRGTQALEGFFATHLDPSTAMPGPLNGDALDALRAASRSQLVVEDSALQPFNGKLPPTGPQLISRNPNDVNDAAAVLPTDDDLERFLQGDDPPALRAAHLLSLLAVIAGELPSVARGVAFANPPDWVPSDQFVQAVLAGLRGNPLLRPVTADTMFDDTPRATADEQAGEPPVVRTLAPVPIRKPPVTLGDYYQAAKDRDGIAALFGTADPRVERADRSMLTVLTSDWQGPAGRQVARGLLQAIGQSGRDFLSRIQVPLQSTVTLTSSRAQVPLTFRNDADRPVRIHVALQSTKLLFPEGADRDATLTPGKNLTLRIAVETRSSGSYPMVMTVTTAGGLPIQTSQVTVRSSFVSGVGVFLTVGALVFLALWWGWDIRRRRRARAANRRVPA